MQWVISKFKCRVVNVEHLYWAGNPFLMEGGSIFRDLIPVSLFGASATNWIAALCRLVSWSFFRVDQIWAVHRPAQHSMKGEIRPLEFAPHFVMNYRGPMLSTSSEWFIDSHECLSLYQWLIAWQSIRLPVESICGPSAILKQQILSCVHMDSVASDAHGLTVISSCKCPVQGPKLLELNTWESVSCLKAVKFLWATGASLMLVEEI